MRQYIDLIEGAGLASWVLRLGLRLAVGCAAGRLGDGHYGHQVLAFAPGRSSASGGLPFRCPIGGLYLHDGRGEQGVRLQRRVVRQLLHHRRLRQLQILVGQQPSGRSRLDVPLTAHEAGGRGIPGAVAGRQTVLRSAHAAADGSTGTASSSSHSGSQGGQWSPGSK